MSARNPFRIGDVVRLRIDDGKVGLVRDLDDQRCEVAWYNNAKGSYSHAVWVRHDTLTLSNV